MAFHTCKPRHAGGGSGELPSKATLGKKCETLSENKLKTKDKSTGSIAQVVEHRPSKHEALSSTSKINGIEKLSLLFQISTPCGELYLICKTMFMNLMFTRCSTLFHFFSYNYAPIPKNVNAACSLKVCFSSAVRVCS
jgi:hypothetical protein